MEGDSDRDEDVDPGAVRMNGEYALFNLIILAIPLFGLSLLRQRSITWSMVHRVLIPAVIFSIWDSIVTGDWWNFNQAYISGLYLANLPIEEVAFFFTVPLACLSMWQHIKPSRERYVYPWIRWVLFLCFVLGVGIMGAGLHYTGSVVISSSALLLYDSYQHQLFFQRRGVWMTIFILCMTALWNTYLTARPVVMYNPQFLSGFRLGTIPIEDFFYGWSLIALTIIVFEWKKNEP